MLLKSVLVCQKCWKTEKKKTKKKRVDALGESVVVRGESMLEIERKVHELHE